MLTSYHDPPKITTYLNGIEKMLLKKDAYFIVTTATFAMIEYPLGKVPPWKHTTLDFSKTTIIVCFP